MVNKMIKFIKQHICSHPGIEATITENPSPQLFLDIKAKCTECGIDSFESLDIYVRAENTYKRRLAEAVLFQRNIDKFPEFYENKIKEQHGIKNET